MYDMDVNNHKSESTNYEQINLMNGLRKLWEQHVWWTRSFIISVAEGLDELELVAERLLRNPTDFANVLAIYYGKDKADTFRMLLEEHLKIGAVIVTSAKNGDAEAVGENLKLWYDNADDIVEFLVSINPHWDREQWKGLFYDHLKMTTDMIAARLADEYAKDIMIFEMIEEQALRMADFMSVGMMNQFEI